MTTGLPTKTPLEEATSPPRRRSVLSRVMTPRNIALTLAVALVSYLTLVPLIFLVNETFRGPGGFSFDAFHRAYSAHDAGTMLFNSVRFASGATIMAVVMGTSMAYITVRTNVPWKPLIYATAIVPLVLPGILETIAWIFLASPRIGVLNAVLEPIFGPSTFNIYSIWGMIWVEGLSLFPLVFLLMVAAFRNMDPSLEESALMSGASMLKVARMITIPMVRPALLGVTLMMAVLAMESFEGPALIGIPAGIWVFTSRIWRVLNDYPLDIGEAGAYAVTLLLLTGIGVYLQSRISRNGRAFQTVTGKGFRPRPLDLGGARWVVTAFVGLFFVVIIVMPLAILAYASTQGFYAVPSAESIGRASFDNYTRLAASPEALNALGNSMILSLTSATTIVILVSVLAWIVIRTKWRGRWLIDQLTYVPLVVPGMVLGISLLVVYLRIPIGVYGTLWIMFIAYCTKYIPYGMRYVSASMVQISTELEESAQMAGATWWKTFRHITLPLLRPGLIAGWVYIVVVGFRELSTSILIYSPGNEVVSIMIWEAWQNGAFGQAAAMGMVLIVILAATVLAAYRLGVKVKVVG